MLNARSFPSLLLLCLLAGSAGIAVVAADAAAVQPAAKALTAAREPIVFEGFAAQESSSNAASQKKASGNSPVDEKKAEDDLDHAISEASNDRAALIRNLEDYLKRYPDAPRKAAIYRALVETSQQLQDSNRALNYAERLIALQPDDTDMMMLAVGLLEAQGDPEGLSRAVDYTDRVLERTEKAQPADRPARESLAEWQAEQDRRRVALYLIRGRMEMEQRNFPLAIRDLSHSYELHPNASAAEKLGEIAEMQHRLPDALQEYSSAFVLPEEGIGGKVDRRLVRQKLGNVWRQLHGSDAGMGDAVMAAYDRLSAPVAPAVVSRNQGARDLFSYVLRKLDGAPFPLATLRGKILVLNFWATWCGPCRALEPLFAQVQQHYAGASDVSFFAVNIDEDESRVPAFVHDQKMSVPVLFADGLDEFLNLPSIPVVVVIDQQGRTIYSAIGFEQDTFVERLTAAIDGARQPPH